METKDILFRYKVSAISIGGNRLIEKVAKTKKKAQEIKFEYFNREDTLSFNVFFFYLLCFFFGFWLLLYQSIWRC